MHGFSVTQPPDWQFTNISTLAWCVVLHCKSFMITFSLRKLVYAST